MIRRAVSLAGVLLVLTVSPAAKAGVCPASPGTSRLVEEQAAETRLAYLLDRLPRAQTHAQRWFYGWIGTYSALAVGQAALVPVFSGDPYRQRTFSINAASAALGGLFLSASPPRLLGLKRRAERQVTQGAAPCTTLLYVEHELARAARKEKFGTSWVMHGGNVLFNFGVGLVLGLTWGYWDYAFYTRSAGILLGEMLIWTRPEDATHILADYRSGVWTAGPMPGRARPVHLAVLPWVNREGAGLSLSWSL